LRPPTVGSDLQGKLDLAVCSSLRGYSHLDAIVKLQCARMSPGVNGRTRRQEARVGQLKLAPAVPLPLLQRKLGRAALQSLRGDSHFRGVLPLRPRIANEPVPWLNSHEGGNDADRQ